MEIENQNDNRTDERPINISNFSLPLIQTNQHLNQLGVLLNAPLLFLPKQVAQRFSLSREVTNDLLTFLLVRGRISSEASAEQ